MNIKNLDIKKFIINVVTFIYLKTVWRCKKHKKTDKCQLKFKLGFIHTIFRYIVSKNNTTRLHIQIYSSLMIKNIPSSFEYYIRDARIRDETFSMPDYGIGHGRVNSSPEEKRLPRNPAVSDILPGIVAQVKREVGSPFLYYSR